MDDEPSSDQRPKRTCGDMQVDAVNTLEKQKKARRPIITKMQVEPTRVSARRAGNEFSRFITNINLNKKKVEQSIKDIEQSYNDVVFFIQTHNLNEIDEIKSEILGYNNNINILLQKSDNILSDITAKRTDFNKQLTELNTQLTEVKNKKLAIQMELENKQNTFIRDIQEIDKTIQDLEECVTLLKEKKIPPYEDVDQDVDHFTFFGSFVLANLEMFPGKHDVSELLKMMIAIEKAIKKGWKLKYEYSVYILSKDCEYVENLKNYEPSKTNQWALSLELDNSSKLTQIVNSANSDLQNIYNTLSENLTNHGFFFNLSQHIKEQIFAYVQTNPTQSLLSAYPDDDHKIVYEIDILQIIELINAKQINILDEDNSIIEQIRKIAKIVNTSENIDLFLDQLKNLSIIKEKPAGSQGGGRKSSIKQAIKKQTPAQKAKDADRKEKEKLKQKAIKEKEKLKKQKEAAKAKERALKEKLKQKAIKEKEKLKKQKEALKKKEQQQKEKRIANEKLEKAEKAKAKTPTRNASTKKRASIVQKKKASTK